MQKLVLLTLAMLFLVPALPGSTGTAVAASSAGPARRGLFPVDAVSAKIERTVLTRLQQGETPRALIVFAAQADLSAAENLATRQEKGRYVYATLRDTASRTQGEVRALLDREGYTYRAYYVMNLIAVEKLDAGLAAQLAARPDIGRIVGNPDVRLSEPLPAVREPEAANAVEWGVDKIGAPKMWARGFKGQGIVIANQDTGVQWTHPALMKKYRGYDPVTGKARHSYNWWDAIHSTISPGDNPCGVSVRRPCDDGMHGTHTMGTLVGRAGKNRIGVAPRAQWIACRNMERSVGRPSTYIECYEFFLAPWNKRGNHPDPDRAPDIISNSWYCPADEGCAQDTFLTVNNNLRAAGIFLAVAAGNTGPGCSSVSEPPDHYDSSTSVGATNSSDELVSFSSRGPVTVDGSNRLKPDLAAPGANVRSSVPNNAYAQLSGTSMAAPHLAGAVALLWDAVPALVGKIGLTEKALFAGAFRNVTIQNDPTQSCGGTDASVIPNNLFGYGRLDVWRAYQATQP